MFKRPLANGFQSDVQRLESVEAKMRLDLHDRLESMVSSVEQVVLEQEQSKERSITYETDEMYVFVCARDTALAIYGTDIFKVSTKVQELCGSV